MSKDVGKTHGRPDLDRCGLFWEMSYMNGPYVKPLQFVSARSDIKAFFAPTPKWKRELQDCYFEKDPLKRIFTGESFWDGLREYLKEQVASNKKNLSKTPFITFLMPKATSTPRDHFGTFDEKNFPAFSPGKRPEPKKETKRGIYIPYPKEGTFGYIGYTFDKFPEHKSDPYDAAPTLYTKELKEHKKNFLSGPFKTEGLSAPYFDPNPYIVENPKPPYRSEKPPGKPLKGVWVWGGPVKKLAGDKSGTFDKYPPHSDDKYLTLIQVLKEHKKRLKKYATRDSGTFNIPSESKKWLIKSTADYNIKYRVNAKNWKSAKPFVVN